MEILLVLFGVGLLSAVFSGSDDGGADSPTESDDDTLELTDGFDTVSGGVGNDLISGLKGFDDLSGDGGDDTLYGGDGKDLLQGGDGADELHGDAWHDGLFGGDGNDELYGGNGKDILVGEDGDDTLFGGAQDDGLYGGLGANTLFGGEGDDRLFGARLYDDVSPEEYGYVRDEQSEYDDGRGWISGLGKQDDTDGSELYGGDGNDHLILGSNDVAYGGQGNDGFVVGDWIEDGSPAKIMDFNGAEDGITVASDFAPEYEFIRISDSEARIEYDGKIVAEIQGDVASYDGHLGMAPVYILL